MTGAETKKEKAIARNKKIHRILEHEREHKEQREKMPQADGGHAGDTGIDVDIETLRPSWADRTDDMRARLRKRKAKAKAMWR
jgi:hypothetical protein